MLRYQIRDATKLGRPKTTAARKSHRVQPNLCDMLIALDVNMGRLGTVARVEEETIRTNSEDSRH